MTADEAIKLCRQALAARDEACKRDICMGVVQSSPMMARVLSETAPALIAEIEHLSSSAASPWIPSTTRLPEEGQRVLGWFADNSIALIATYTAEHGWPFSHWAEIRGPE